MTGKKAGALFAGFLLIGGLFAVGSAPASAQGSIPIQGVEAPQDTRYGLDEFENVGIGKNTDLKGTIANIINIALGFLGVIAVVIIIYAGFKWMTAAGNEEQVSEARKMLVQAVAGLVIIFLAWIIANFVIERLEIATGVSR